ncbi:MAG: hypothetical protein KBC84_05150, partial [Proteobacteria bacterium]|nr:hypothetical protein [Pseudomonadota bacterium]
ESLFGVHANVVKNGKFSFSGIEAVYLGEGKATFVKVPGFYMEKSATGEERLHGHRLSIHDLARSIPQEIRGKKYDTYFRDRIHMKDSHSGSDLYRTTYVLDEFSAYVRDAKCSLEHYDWYVKTKSGVVAEFHGAGEFVGYGMSLVKLIHDNPDQYKTDQDRDHAYKVIGYLMQEGAALYKEGLNEKKYPRLQSAHADFLVKLQKQKSLVDVAKKVYGEAWVESLFSRE